MTEHLDSKNGLSLPMSILIAAVLISGSIIYLVGALRPTPVSPPGPAADNTPSAADLAALLEVGSRDVILGEANAPVTLIEYGDYQCPFCARFYRDTESLIREEYVKAGKVRMVFRDLAFLGPESRAAAEAAECAKDQGKFWAYHDALYEIELVDQEEHNGNLNRELFLDLAGDNGLDMAAFTSCLDGGTHRAVVQESLKKANAAGINATPTSLVNGKLIEGAQPYVYAGPDAQVTPFKEVIEAALAAQ